MASAGSEQSLIIEEITLSANNDSQYSHFNALDTFVFNDKIEVTVSVEGESEGEGESILPESINEHVTQAQEEGLTDVQFVMTDTVPPISVDKALFDSARQEGMDSVSVTNTATGVTMNTSTTGVGSFTFASEAGLATTQNEQFAIELTFPQQDENR